MANPALQQLRDIHVPEPPGLWPPAPGWWLLAGVLAVAAAWLFWRARAARQRRRPLKRASALYQNVHRRWVGGQISAREYLNQSNDVIKRALIYGLGERQARRATGRAWLAMLDRHMGEPAFSRGAGALLGDARFRPRLAADVAAVHPLVERLLARLATSRHSAAEPRREHGP